MVCSALSPSSSHKYMQYISYTVSPTVTVLSAVCSSQHKVAIHVALKLPKTWEYFHFQLTFFFMLGHDFQDTWTMMFSMSNKHIMWRKFLNMTVWQSHLPEVWPGPSSLDSHFGREQSKKRQRNRKQIRGRKLKDEDEGNRETVLWPTEYLNLHHALVSGVRALWLRSPNEKVSNCGAALWSEDLNSPCLRLYTIRHAACRCICTHTYCRCTLTRMYNCAYMLWLNVLVKTVHCILNTSESKCLCTRVTSW